ncbi:unnamed protein product [Clonostachys solani]|uniref:Uncharacterized protein n=1 Tax=Clonostachys solani TaxID=160281 RepID=A0A9N9WBE8_9HYPO|nr:unnamed protein product [Clonostachys solani]
MQFFKFLSLFALSSVATAQLAGVSEGDLSPRDFAEAAEAEYLVARDEYIEKRDIFRRAGGNGKCASAGKSGYKQCRRYDAAKKTTINCGPCDKNAAIGQYCLCNW